MTSSTGQPSALRASTYSLSLFVGHWAPVILWMWVIFLFSSTSALPQAPSELLDALIKKSAHVGEYAILALLVHRAIRSHGAETRRVGLLAVALCSLYAMSDEFHQTLIPGRHPSFVDVGLDTAASAAALVAASFFRGRSRGHSGQVNPSARGS